ncbi:anti-sigma factor family protein [Blastomonas aquatica]|uniref:Anti-sigma factor n=1 Tax=Blastomonas aquatica TaxID=1510276 RepID=A0ABQ1JLA3_9SPHN|nr:hypothetical protein [Blastomonas aquatica]GGB69931.1 anti-sigma factor [Blastomonas aquatica]
MNISPEMIAAFADGELEGADKAQVEAAVAADPTLASEVERHRRLKAVLAARYAPIVTEKVPAHLVSLLQTSEPHPDTVSEVISFAAARRKRGLAPMIRRWVTIAGPAIAASLVLALWQPWQASLPEGYAGAELASVLDNRLVANQSADAEPRILLSFAAEGGKFCRAWRGATDGGIACRDRNGWKIERAFAVSGTSSTEYRQAGSEVEILAAAQEMAAGNALDAQGEKRASATGWRTTSGH